MIKKCQTGIATARAPKQTLDGMIASQPVAQRAAANRRAEQLIAEELTLRKSRKAKRPGQRAAARP